MGRPEGVENKKVGKRGQLPGEVRVVFFLLNAEAEVFHQHHLAGLEGGAFGLGVGAQHVLGHGDGDTQQLFQVIPGGEEGELLLPLAVGTAHVGQEDDSGAVVQQVADGGQRGYDPGVVVNDTGGLVVGNVEIAAQEDLFPATSMSRMVFLS